MHNKILTFVLCSLLLLVACARSEKRERIEPLIAEDGDNIEAKNEDSIIPIQFNAIEDDSESVENDFQINGFFNPIGVVGNGIIMLECYPEERNDEHRFLSIYNNPECTSLYCKYNFIDVYDLPEGKNIIPFYFKPDYGYYCFVCVAETPKSYEIAVNKKGRKFLKKEAKTAFYPWDKFFERVFFINSTEDNPLRLYASDNAPAAPTDRYDDLDLIDIYCERKVEIDGDWLHLTFPKAQDEEYWIRWKRGNDIIIEIAVSI